ncbi:copper-binding protein [Achromobacter aloeverae]
MKTMTILVAAACSAVSLAHSALAADDMAGMKMDGGAVGAAKADDQALTDAVIKKVDSATNMVTLQHGALANVGMPAMTMAFRVQDSSMLTQAKEGERVRVRVENVNGVMTIVKLAPR